MAKRLEEEGTSKKNVLKLSESEIDTLLSNMESNAKNAPYIELNDENWRKFFGERNAIETPVGEVKMGENQNQKLIEKNRTNQLGMVVETLSNPDIILEEDDKKPNKSHERNYANVYIKTFVKEDAKGVRYFESISIYKEGLEISISSHRIKDARVKSKIADGRVVYIEKT